MENELLGSNELRITIEGYTGSGKSTIARFLMINLENAGVHCSYENVDRPEEGWSTGGHLIAMMGMLREHGTVVHIKELQEPRLQLLDENQAINQQQNPNDEGTF
jgi:thymidylate kinase